MRESGAAPRVVRIGDDAGRTALLVDGVVQSISPDDGLSAGGYWAAMLPDERPRQALILGLGGGTLARLLRARWGNMRMVGVDNDDAILAVASSAGWLPTCGLEIVQRDAFEYVQTCHERFDYVAIDLFRGDHLAARAFGKPFLRRVRNLLEPRGRLAVNLFSDRQRIDRVNRVALFFEIRSQVDVGGNVVVHARNRRPN
jgi:spermidine synthase